ncbi:lipopolysaccharide biosynthesis protein [Mucilaginibacter sp.]|uniref:lipopolysaccharide biosynthesis protein n=1 Tax=Mucilaginibacter sp. TaxID=1882438 RepID=UPI003B006915
MNINHTVARSIIGSAIFKLSAAAVSFISVPLLLNALGTNDYAIWVTMTTLVAWLNLFDFGSGYSLKNKVTEALANKNLSEIQPLIAGTIQFYLIMTVLILFCFLCSLVFVGVFKSHSSLAILIYLPIIFSFPFTLGHFIIQGLKKFNFFYGVMFLQSLSWLAIIVIFKNGYIKSSINVLAICFSMLFVFANGTIYFISLKEIKFKFKAIVNFKNFSSSKTTILLGGKFFFLQLSSLFLYSLGNVLTYNHLNLIKVAQFDTVNKIYLMGITVFNIIISVYWAEISQEKALRNKKKLLLLYNQLILLSSLFVFGCAAITLVMPNIIYIWTKHIIMINLNQLYPFLLLVSIQAFSYSGAVVLNAFEKLDVQIILSLLSAILIIPMSNLLFKHNIGLGTVPLASSILTLPTLVYLMHKSRKCIVKFNQNDI